MKQKSKKNESEEKTMILKQVVGNGGFTQISNDLIRNKDLSIGAKMLFIFISSLPKEWKINKQYIAKELGISIQTYYKYEKELVHNGIAFNAQLRDEKGKFQKDFIYICDKDLIEKYQEKESEFLENLDNFIEGKNDNDLSKNKNDEVGLKVEFSGDEADLKAEYKKPVTENLDGYINKEFPINKKIQKAPKKIFALQNFDKIIFFCPSKNSKIPLKLNELLKTSSLNELEIQSYLKFIEYRKERRNALTPTSIEGNLKELESFKAQGHNVISIINKSINNGYLGLFAPFKQQNNATYPKQRSREQDIKELRGWGFTDAQIDNYLKTGTMSDV